MSRTRYLIVAAIAAITVLLTPVSPATAQDEDVTYYIVRDKGEGEPEFLFEIAERYLGEGDRYHEIFALNEGRRQPDGSLVTSPEVLLPGWVLVMPHDASGDGIQVGPLPDGLTASPEPEGAATRAPEPAATRAAEPAGPETSGVPLVAFVAGGGVLLVGAGIGVWLLVRGRRTTSRVVPFDDSLLRADTSSAWMVDRGLRVLMAGCERDGLDVPELAGVFVEGPVMRLRLRNPATPAPAPWTVSEDGSSWSAQIGRLQTEPASSAPTDRFSRLVTVGVGQSGRILLDFAQARGLISLDGSTAARHAALRRWLGELTTNPWSGEPRVVMVGNGMPEQETAEHVSGIEQVTPELVLGDGGVLVLSRPPAVEQQELLAARFADPRFGWVVIVLGAAPVARWRFTAGDDGWLRSGFLPDVRFDEQTVVRRQGAR